MNNNLPIWSLNLKRARKAKGYTQQQISARIFKHITSYAHYERGFVEPSLSTWLLLCEILEIDDLKKFWSRDLFKQAA